jgi:hypothetical protein
MSLGLENAWGAQGAWDALHSIIAERKKDEILKQKAEDDRQERARLLANDAEQRRQFDVTNQRLEEAAGIVRQKQQEQDTINKATRIQNTSEIGDTLTPDKIVALEQAGAGNAVAAKPILTMPGIIEKLGGRANPATSTGGDLVYGGTSAQVHQATAEKLADQRYQEQVQRDARNATHQGVVEEQANQRLDMLAANQGKSGDARLDRSYNKEVSRMDSIAKPVLDRADRLQRLKISLDAQSPQADALIAPELLTAMAGGQGSGLRMNEAEIARIVGGRSKLESLKASLNQWSLDPSKALSITPDQRQQVRALVEKMSAKVDAKVAAVQRAHRGLIDAQDVITQRNVSDALAKELSDIDTRDDAPGGPTPGASTPGTIVKTWNPKTRKFE